MALVRAAGVGHGDISEVGLCDKSSGWKGTEWGQGESSAGLMILCMVCGRQQTRECL